MLTATHDPAPQAGEPGSDTGPSDTRPYLCIPYWEAPRFAGDPVDIGQVRPLPAGVISWECPGVHASPYSPGQPLQVTVDVRNSGHGSATVVATVIVYWADPTVGFAKPSFFGVTTVAVPTMRDRMTAGFVSATVTSVIPASAPSHICLLACITHSLDKAGVAIDPIGDRHWAQHNIVAVSATVNPIIVPFVAANPFESEEMLELRVRALDRRSLELLALRMRLEPSEVRPRLQMSDGLGRHLTDRANEAHISLALGSHGRRPYAVALEINEALAPHQLTAVEVLLYRSKDSERPIGSLGIVVRGHDRDE